MIMMMMLMRMRKIFIEMMTMIIDDVWENTDHDYQGDSGGGSSAGAFDHLQPGLSLLYHCWNVLLVPYNQPHWMRTCAGFDHKHIIHHISPTSLLECFPGLLL